LPTTYVTRLDPAAGKRLYADLGRGTFAFRPLDHAAWSAKGEDVVVTLYLSGKLVVQGRGLEAFLRRHLPDASPSAPPERTAAPAVAEIREETLGSDESGKGDYFGPLVVAAALVRPEDADFLVELGVRDSKLATDGTIRRVEGALAGRLPHAVRVLEPESYNEAWRRAGNLNVLLGRLHAEVIDAVLAAMPDARPRIIVDRFGDPGHVRRALTPTARRRPFSMPTRGEAYPAVAAASFLARAAFLREFERLKGLAGDELYLGASDPRILPLARRLASEGGRAWLAKFAKLHFRITDRL
jgi:ribonuclease HIII